MIGYSVRGRVGEIVIARPDAGNAITGEMAQTLGDILVRAATEADLLTLSGAGDDFTIGRDRQGAKAASPFDAFRSVSAVNKAIAAFPGILIAKVRGRAFGLGVGLTMRSDIAFAAANSRFVLDEVAHGIPPMFIMEEMVNHVAPKRALEIILGGREFGGEEALQMGLLSRVVAADALEETVKEFVDALSGRDQNVVYACKRYMRAVRVMPGEARPAYALVEQTEFAMRKQ